jgi:zinc transporter
VPVNDHIHFAISLSGPRAGQVLTDEAAIADALHQPDLAWLHLQADDPATPEFISEHLGYLDQTILSALTALETRPRAFRHDDGLLVILRAANVSPDQAPEDMVSLRLWLDPARLISLSRRPLAVVDRMMRGYEGDTTQTRPGALLCTLITRIVEPIEQQLLSLEERTDSHELSLSDPPDPALRADIGDLRYQLTLLRRHIAPQRDVLGELSRLDVAWLTRKDRRNLHELHDRLIRVVEELDEFRDRMVLLRDELTGMQSERLNRNLYRLSIISVIFLPLGFLTGLLGVNLGGLPGANWPGAFWVFTGSLAGIGLCLLAILLWRRWL